MKLKDGLIIAGAVFVGGIAVLFWMSHSAETIIAVVLGAVGLFALTGVLRKLAYTPLPGKKDDHR